MKKLMLSLALVALPVSAMPIVAAAQLGNSFTTDEVRSARDKGDVVPLREIFSKLKRQYGGYQVDANLFNRDGGQVYVIDWMTGKGDRVRFTVNAKTGRMISKN